MKQAHKLTEFLQSCNLIGYKLMCIEGPYHTDSNDRAISQRLQAMRLVMTARATGLTSKDSSEEKASKLLGSLMVTLKSK